jgi:hypothetical protein
MDDRKTFVETANDLQESFQDEIETRAVAAYYHFVQDENEKGMAVNAAPAGLIDSHSCTALAPKKPSPTQNGLTLTLKCFAIHLESYHKTMRSSPYLKKAFALVEPFLLRDLFTRLPGRLLRWDGTFNLMKKDIE